MVEEEIDIDAIHSFGASALWPLAPKKEIMCILFPLNILTITIG